MERYIDAIIRWRWAVLIAMLLVVFAVGTGIRHLGLVTDYRAFFGKDNPDLLAFEAFENVYTKDDNVLFVLQPRDGDVFNPRTLAAVAELTDKAWKIPYATRVDSITNFQYTWAESDDLVVEDLLPAGRFDPEAIQRVRKVSLEEPRLRGRLIASDGRTTAVNIRLQLLKQSEAELPAVASHVRALRDEFQERFPDHRFALTGLAMINTAFNEAPLKDMPLVIPLMFGVLVLAMMFFLRSTSGTGATMVVVALAAVTAVGAAGYAGLLFDPASASAPVIILTLGIADSIHILLTYFGGLRRGDSKRDSLVESFRVNGQPVFLTSITSAIGFLSLNFSDSPPFHILGNITAFGVMMAWVYSMTFLPALLAIIPMRVPRDSKRFTHFMSRLSDFIVARPRSLLVSFGILTLVLTASIATLGINDKYVEYFDESMAFRRDSDFTRDHLTGIIQQSYSVEAGEEQGINDPDFLRATDAFVKWARSSPYVSHVSSFTDTMKRLNMNMHGDDPTYHRLPDDRELAAQYLLLYEMNLPYGLDVNDQINVDKSALRIDVTFNDIQSEQSLAQARGAATWLQEHGRGAIQNIKATGPALMFGNITQRNIEGMLVGTGLGFALIALILMVALRSLRLGIVSLIPNIFPAAMAFGIWAIVYREAGFAISVVAGLSIGIIVDDTVHFLSKYDRARRQHGLGPADAVRYALDVVGPAIISTSVIVAAGFAMLGLSAFRVTSYMGLLTALSIICALLADLFLLPSLLIVFDRRKAASSITINSQSEQTLSVKENQNACTFAH